MIIERGQHYQLQSGAVAANTTRRRIPLKLDNDAPFCLRAIAAYQSANADGSGAATGVQGLLRYTDAAGGFMSSDLFGTVEGIQAGGRDSRYTPVWPQQVYPAGATIEVDIGNNTAVAWNDSRVLFWGTKLYPEGVVWSPTYPDCYKSIPFERPINITIGPVGANNYLRSIPIEAPGDSDLVIRAITIGADAGSPAASWTALYAQMRDHRLQPYQNALVHVDWLFSNTLCQRPALFYPEIYVPKKEQLLIDLQRLDAALSLTVQLNLMGERIWKVEA